MTLWSGQSDVSNLPSVCVCVCVCVVRTREEAALCYCRAIMKDFYNYSFQENRSCYDLESVSRPILGIYGFFIAVVVLVTLAGNGVVLVLVVGYKRLRSRSMIASMSLVVADIMWGLCYHFPAFVSVAAVGWPFGDGGCAAFGLLSFEFLVTRWLVMAVVCFDRFCTVRFPFSYDKHSKCVITLLTAVAWILPFLASFFPQVVKFSHESFRPNVPTCLYGCADSDKLCRFYYALVITLSFLLGAILPLLLYVWLYKRARSLKWPRVEMGHTNQQHTAQQTRDGVREDSTPSIRQQHEGPIRDLQAYATFILIVVTLVVTALPAYTSQIFRSADYDNWCKIPIIVHFVIQLIFLSSTALDPLVIMRDRDFRHCLKDMFCCKRWRRGGVDISPTLSQHLQRRRSVDPLLTTHINNNNNLKIICSYPSQNLHLQIVNSCK